MQSLLWLYKWLNESMQFQPDDSNAIYPDNIWMRIWDSEMNSFIGPSYHDILIWYILYTFLALFFHGAFGKHCACRIMYKIRQVSKLRKSYYLFGLPLLLKVFNLYQNRGSVHSPKKTCHHNIQKNIQKCGTLRTFPNDNFEMATFLWF